MTGASKRQKIALFGVFGVGNLGNECTLQAMIFHLRRLIPGAEIICVCSDPAVVSSTYRITAVPIRQAPLRPLANRLAKALRRVFVGIPLEVARLYKSFRALKGVEMLVMTGTGMLGDVGIGPFGLHYDILKWSLVAKLRGCKLLFVSVGVGPLTNPMSKRFVRMSLALANYRSYRDDFSKQYLKELRLNRPADPVFPDLAFSLPDAMIPRQVADRAGQPPVVGVGIITYSNLRESSAKGDDAYREYLARLTAFISWSRMNNYTVRLLIGDAVHDHRARLDLKSSLEAAGLNYGDGKIIDEPASTVDEVISQLAASEIVVASRFHNVLLALWLNKPVLAISFHEKVDSLMQAVGLGEFRQDINDINVDKMTEQFRTLEFSAVAVKAQVKEKAEAYRTALEQQYERIFCMR